MIAIRFCYVCCETNFFRVIYLFYFISCGYGVCCVKRRLFNIIDFCVEIIPRRESIFLLKFSATFLFQYNFLFSFVFENLVIFFIQNIFIRYLFVALFWHFQLFNIFIEGKFNVFRLVSCDIRVQELQKKKTFIFCPISSTLERKFITLILLLSVLLRTKASLDLQTLHKILTWELKSKISAIYEKVRN